MKFHPHPDLVGTHSFLSPSQGSRFNYDEEKLIKTYSNIKGIERGTRLHDLASQIIDISIQNPEAKVLMAKNGSTFNRYVNDAINFKLKTEVPLYYSFFCHGTADGLSYRNKLLRIHDLKTGVQPASFGQLERYAALFILEYGAELGITAMDISYELRIYQSGEVKIEKPSGQVIQESINYIVWADAVLQKHFGNGGIDIYG